MAKQAEEPKFYLGICMAGAVSAGAYTAGVMDYLLEALAAYEEKRGKPGFPSHKIEIPVIGGASAGGMTSIITAAAMQQGITHIKEPGTDLLKDRPENMLYHSWVDLTNPDMFGEMMKTDDIKDASWFRPNSELAPTILNPTRTVGQTFLGAERNLLVNRGLWP